MRAERIQINLYNVFLDDGREDPNSTKSRPSSARLRNAIEMAFRWRVENGPSLNVGLVVLLFLWDPDQYC